MGERSVRIREVEGSNPFVSTMKKMGYHSVPHLFHYSADWGFEPEVARHHATPEMETALLYGRNIRIGAPLTVYLMYHFGCN